MIMDPDAGSVDSEVGRVDCGKVFTPLLPMYLVVTVYTSRMLYACQERCTHIKFT